MKVRFFAAVSLVMFLQINAYVKGDDYMRIDRYKAHSTERGLEVDIPIRWRADGTDLVIWLDLDGRAPKSPPVMPFELKGRRARKGYITHGGALFDSSLLTPGNTYPLNVRVEFVGSDGKTVTDSQTVNVTV